MNIDGLSGFGAGLGCGYSDLTGRLNCRARRRERLRRDRAQVVERRRAWILLGRSHDRMVTGARARTNAPAG